MEKKVKGVIRHMRARSLLFGAAGSIALLMVYFGILIFANSFSHAVEQFIQMWYWVLILAIGFGIQVGLYSHIRSFNKNVTGATAEVAVAGGISTGSMVACCVHHVTDVVPILGLSAAAVFFGRFQTLFIIIGVLSNLVGINMMLKIIQEHNLYDKSKEGFFSKLMRIDMKRALYFSSVFSMLALVLTLFNNL